MLWIGDGTPFFGLSVPGVVALKVLGMENTFPPFGTLQWDILLWTYYGFALFLVAWKAPLQSFNITLLRCCISWFPFFGLVSTPPRVVLIIIAACVMAHLSPGLFCQEYQCYMGICMSVEVNTWFLIARRVFNKQGFEPWMINLPYLFSVRVKLISIFFYITWVTTRCIFYPLMMIRYSELYMERFRKGSKLNIMLMVSIIHFIFCLLNARWSVDLCQSKLRQWRMKAETKIEKGLWLSRTDGRIYCPITSICGIF
jgi:hypothetical protein